MIHALSNHCHTMAGKRKRVWRVLSAEPPAAFPAAVSTVMRGRRGGRPWFRPLTTDLCNKRQPADCLLLALC